MQHQTNQQLLDRIEELEHLLGIDDDFRQKLRLVFGVTKRESVMLGLLLKRPIATREALWVVMYGAMSEADQPSQGSKLLDCFMCKIRKKLRPFKIKIGVIWAEGYSLSLSDKEKLNKVLRQGRANGNG